ncbi:septin-11 [Camelus ferus]|nr:septin-11 [Camelus ferus]
MQEESWVGAFCPPAELGPSGTECDVLMEGQTRVERWAMLQKNFFGFAAFCQGDPWVILSFQALESLQQPFTHWGLRPAQEDGGQGARRQARPGSSPRFRLSPPGRVCREDQPAAVPAPLSENEENEDLRNLSLSGHVGFDSLPDQLVNKSTSQGFCFNILCVGETGIGKSTLMDTLFNTKFENDPATHNEPGVRLKARSYELQESNVRLKLTIVDTVGFGDQINKDDSYKPIVEYIDAQFEAYLQEELKIKRSLFNYHDTRIHACLYFIAPTGHSLKSLDLVTMKKLDSKVNIIPIIAKADTIAKNELHKFKSKIMSELVSNGVQIYQFPTDEETVAEINATMSVHLPFAVVGSTEEVKIGNKMAKARQYPWGVVQVENENHCDFVKLREMLIRVNMEDLREQTHTRHYELYRRCKLEEMGFKDTDPDSKPFSVYLVLIRESLASLGFPFVTICGLQLGREETPH